MIGLRSSSETVPDMFRKKPLNDENNSKSFNVNKSPIQQRLQNQQIRQPNSIQDFPAGYPQPLGLSNSKSNSSGVLGEKKVFEYCVFMEG